MARIVRVEAPSGASVGSGTVCVHLADELLPADTGTYTLGADRGRLTVERGGRQEAETTISALTAMLYGSVGGLLRP